MSKPYTLYEVQDTAKRKRWPRILLWSALCVAILAAALAGGSYLWFRGQVGGANARVSAAAREQLQSHPASTIAPVPDPPNSMNILVLGSDNRGDETNGRSDTMMLVHVDRSQNFVSILSIPRDLYVEVPGHGKQKINAAYSYGGAALAIETVQNVTGIDINQYLEIDFKAFEDITDSLGGVYVDVDRRYYNDDPTREIIKISPGYQLLGGHDALEFVRFRYDQNADFGRMARQQRFLRDLRQQAMSWNNLTLRLPGLTSALFGNAATTLSSNEVLRLAYWGVTLSGDRIKQVVMIGDITTAGEQSVVVVSQDKLSSYLSEFLSAPTPGTGQPSPGQSSVSEVSPAGATAPSDAGTVKAVQTIPDASEWKALSTMVPYALEGPGFIPEGFKYSDRMPQKGGVYDIVPGDDSKPALRMIYRYGPGGVKSDLYLGITETTWTSAPAAGKGQEVTRNGVTYTIVGSGADADHVWWKTDGVLYFISNTLTYTVSRADLLTMAESMTPVHEQ